MNVLESIVGNLMKARQLKLQKILKPILSALIVGILGVGFGLSQEAESTLTPVQVVQTETELSAKDATATEEDVNQGGAIVTTTVTTTPLDDTSNLDAKNPESLVCDALATQIKSNLADYPDWQISLNDDYGNVQGLGEMGPNGLELQLFNSNATELYLYYFTDEEAITIANSSGLRISLFERDGSGADSRGIIINATIGKNREAQPINECILPFEKVFPNYVIK